MLALANGDVDAWVTDAVTRIFMKQNPGSFFFERETADASSLPASTGTPPIRRNDARFLNWVRNWLQYHTAQGTIDYWCREYWFSWMAD